VLSGSNTKPIFVALGAATVLTVSAVAVPVAAFAVDPSPMASEGPAPDPSGSPPATDPPTSPPPDSPPPGDGGSPGPPHSPPPHDPAPSLTVRLSLSAATAAPGGSVTATAKVSAQRAVAHHAVVRFSASSATVGGSVSLGDLGSGSRSATSVVRVPAGHGSGSTTVTATLSADKASIRSSSGKIMVTASGGGPAAANVPGGDLPLSPSAPVPGLPGSAAALGGPAQAQLPLIAQQPATAPGRRLAAQPVSLRTNTSPFGLDTTSYRLFWTQVAWLTALLVGVSLLLTQLRLNRRRLVARAAVRGSRKARRRR
jgi:hypothetical protein